MSIDRTVSSNWNQRVRSAYLLLSTDGLSRLGRLPLACYPDIGPFANIVPVSTVVRSSFFQDEVSLNKYPLQ